MIKNKMATENYAVSQRELTHNKIVRSAASEGIVLLKNDGSLPFNNEMGSIALYGKGARRTIKGGTGSGDVNVREFISIETGLENAGYQVITKPYLDTYDSVIQSAHKEYADMLSKVGKTSIKNALLTMLSTPFQEPQISPVSATEIKKYKADAAVYILSRNSGEGADRKAEKGDYYLSDEEVQDIKILSESYDKFILLLNTGGIIELSDIINNQNINSVLLISQGGSAFGDAVADILSGKKTPSGKLCATWAKKYSDYPFSDEFSDKKYLSDTYYKEGIFVGYRWFDKKRIEPLFPFGFGLSYADFKLQNICTDVKKDTVNIICEVKNISKYYSGKEIIQVYISQPEGKLCKAEKNLVAFKKTKELSPNESQCVSLSFQMKDISSYDEESESYILEKGKYIVFIGNSSASIKPAAVIELSETVTTEKCRNVCECKISDTNDFSSKKEMSYSDIPKFDIDSKSIITSVNDYTVYEIAGEKTEYNYTLDDVREEKISLTEFINDLNEKELITLSIGASRVGLSDLSFIGNASKSIPGAAGDTCDELFNNRKIPPLSTADGPAGVRVNKKIYEKDGLYIENPADDPIKSLLLPKEMQNVNLDGTTVKYQFCTAIPIAAMLAQTWNTEIIEECGKLVANEVNALGLDLLLAPALNIQRNPLCGRNFEYYSEDPFMSGKCAAAMVKGFQHCGNGAVAKHFACNNKENNRNYNNSVVSERALREIYLKGFEICVKESSPFSIMSSYNLINGIHTANHKGILNDVLRCEWGFDGIVMTDWYATQGTSPYENGYYASSSVECIKAGNDIIMPGRAEEIDILKSALCNGSLNITDLKKCAYRIIKSILKMR